MTLLQYVNLGNQRTAVTRTGENTANYTYDAIGQVIADQATEVSGGAARVNEQLYYGFDPAGNLNYRTNNTLIENFQVNSLNELTANTNGGKLMPVSVLTIDTFYGGSKTHWGQIETFYNCVKNVTTCHLG